MIAGVDEAGRGCLAGPVVAAAIILPAETEIIGLKDSKLLSEDRRAALYEKMIALADVKWGIGICTEEEILNMNILRASQEAMRRAVLALPKLPEHTLVDGVGFDPFPTPMTPIVHGDAICRSIAAASIIAKVTRDRLMTKLDATYPGYHFSNNKGYGTTAHLAALKKLGPCPAHRKTFAPIRDLCQSALELWHQDFGSAARETLPRDIRV